MDSENQQRIFGYFIEEAKEHLDTLQQGILNLSSVVQEPETLNEMFRAAHSVKGGAAMLGLSSIQKTAHQLEDAFKFLTDNQIKVDQKLETLFLQGYDTLEDLIKKLQGPFGLQEEDAKKAMQAAEPNFAKLQSYLSSLASSDKKLPKTETTSAQPNQVKAASNLSPEFSSQVLEILKRMLQLFKQPETPSNRQNLQKLCKRLAQLGVGIKTWKRLVTLSYKAIANANNSYQTLAPVVIKEIKQASDQLQENADIAITPSPELQKLAGIKPTSTSTPKQITIKLEPTAAAKALIQAFDKPQLSQLVKLLAKATGKSSLLT
ncbi:MAG: histidine kinase [Symploca sp. SIO3C6]|nr:histidine kinase [Symploca sp. SIO3C6]